MVIGIVLFILSGRLYGDVDDRRPKEVLQRYEETRLEAADQTDTKTKGWFVYTSLRHLASAAVRKKCLLKLPFLTYSC